MKQERENEKAQKPEGYVETDKDETLATSGLKDSNAVNGNTDPQATNPSSSGNGSNNGNTKTGGSNLDSTLRGVLESDLDQRGWFSRREEKRRTFWHVYCTDRYYSLVTGCPCSFTVDANSIIMTRLPSYSNSIFNNNNVNGGNGDGITSQRVNPNETNNTDQKYGNDEDAEDE
ncbi:unnamed protein product, partial [[Candida] boidinii]